MRLLVEDIVLELNRLLNGTKSLREKVLLERAFEALKEYRELTKRKMI